ncbi:hypothetical protein [Rhizobium sp. P007]|uniref:hypothetical protein n=1 Tax=Rhizobium sp. P007 TaxID=285908 RepID=UPI0011589AA4|nr:hypothetical protein [Rhizobium sp. P007]CAD7058305.1 hypothetical protein RP007_05840 [Rhizobium sp. P007]
MADAALSALFDSAQAPIVKLMQCAECHLSCERKSARQKWCEACSTSLRKIKQKSYKANVPVSHGKIGHLFSCERCSRQTIKEHGAQRRCLDCKEIGEIERDRKRSPGRGTILVITTCMECGERPTKSGRAKYCLDCKVAVKARHAKESRSRHKEKIAAKKASDYVKNREVILQKVSEWRSANPDRRREQSARSRESPQTRLRYSISNGIRVSLKRGKGGRSWEELLGYCLDDLVIHLERQFLPGMNWENYGKDGWHVDHIVPDCSFTYETPLDEEFKACWSLANLRPLWEKDNLSKSGKRIFLL